MTRFEQHAHSGVAEDPYHDHDGLGEHYHDRSGQAVWLADNIVFSTVGIDVGSSTSHLMFARLHLQRTSRALTSRFVVVDRQVVWRSPILLTPYRSDFTIDAEQLAAFIADGYLAAGIAQADIDAGAVILTGEALKRTNARAIADIVSRDAGKFVCAAAGHHMEALMGAHGSGAVQRSKDLGHVVLNVDIGGGTTKFALIDNGTVVGTCAIAVGARLLVTDPAGRIVRVEEPMLEVARSLDIPLRLGAVLAAADRERIVTRMIALLVDTTNRQPPDALAARVLVTDPWDAGPRGVQLAAITFSGGVAEYLYGRETADFGDLGPLLARGLRAALDDGRIAAELHDPGQGIRATVTGASQFTVQVSGNTIAVTDPGRLPLRNVPVVLCPFAFGETIDPAAVAEHVRRAVRHADLDDATLLALAFTWAGEPTYPRFAALAEGIATARAAAVAAGVPLILLIDGDVGMTIGRILHELTGPDGDVIAIDALSLGAFDYVDIGEILPNDVVAVTVKSLLF